MVDYTEYRKANLDAANALGFNKVFYGGPQETEKLANTIFKAHMGELPQTIKDNLPSNIKEKVSNILRELEQDNNFITIEGEVYFKPAGYMNVECPYKMLETSSIHTTTKLVTQNDGEARYSISANTKGFGNVIAIDETLSVKTGAWDYVIWAAKDITGHGDLETCISLLVGEARRKQQQEAGL